MMKEKLIIMKVAHMIPKKNRKIAFRVIDGETVAVQLFGSSGPAESVFAFNEAGTAIWNLVDGRRTVPEIAKTLSEEYVIEYKDAKKETESFLKKLKELNMVSFGK